MALLTWLMGKLTNKNVKQRHLAYQTVEPDEVMNDGITNDYVAFDIETTGLYPYADRIIEIGAVKVRGRKIVDQWSSLIDPRETLMPNIEELTGITDTMLEGQPGIEQVLPAFFDWIGKDTLLGHNSRRFDLKFLEAEANTVGMEFPAFQDMDTLQMSRALFPNEQHHRLVDLVRRFGIADNEAHRALSDAIQTQQCFEWMRNYVHSYGGDFHTKTSQDKPRHGNASATRHYSGNAEHDPKNRQPEGEWITEHENYWQTAPVSKPLPHQDLFQHYNDGDEVWVQLTRSHIASGKDKGKATIDIALDGEYAGSLTALQAAKHYLQVPQNGGVTLAHFKKNPKTGRFQLRASFPYSHRDDDLGAYVEPKAMK